MASLYGRLFTYRGREHRTPLEDFLSEALADLLSRLPPDVMGEALKFLLQDSGGVYQELTTHLSDAVWRTQRSIDQGRRLDLTLEKNGIPLLIVENKIGAGFQYHQSGGEEGEPVWHDQLATYAKWLARQPTGSWKGAIVLLTHATAAPDGFCTNEQMYPGRHRSVVHWHQFAQWLKSTVDAAEHEDTWVGLADDLRTFLKEQNLTRETATQQDMAALQVYIGSADRMKTSVELIWEGSRDLWRPICQNERVIELSTEYGCIWKWRSLAGRYGNGYLAVGIRFPAVADAFAEEFDHTDHPYLFVELANDVPTAILSRLKLPSPWSSSGIGHLARLAMGELPAGGEDFVAAAQLWVRDRITEIAAVIG